MTPALAQVAEHLDRASAALPDYAHALVHVRAAKAGLPEPDESQRCGVWGAEWVRADLRLALKLSERPRFQPAAAAIVADVEAWLVQQLEGAAKAVREA